MPKKSLSALTGRTIRCILFDLGDTLWSRKDMTVWQRMETAANEQAAAFLRKYISSSFLLSLTDVELGARLHEAIDEQIRTFIRQEPELEPNSELAVAQVLEHWHISGVDSTTHAAIFEALRVRIPESRPLFDDVLSTLAGLQQRGFQLGVVTNRLWGGEIFQEDLQTLGLFNYFDPRHIAISVDLGIRKPNPAIFLHVLNALNIPPEQAVMVGDSLRSDIIGGKMLGMLTVWKPKPGARNHLDTDKMPSGVSSHGHQIFTSSESTLSVGPADLPLGMHLTDDDYVLARVPTHVGTWAEHLQKDIEPDLIIEKLSDLLDIFIKVGEQ